MLGATPKDEGDALLDAGMPFAKKSLEQHGEFFPFAFAMSKDGKIAAVAIAVSSDRPKVDEVIGKLREALRAGAASGDYRATALFVDVRIQPPGKSVKTDAVHAEIEHAAGYCLDVFFPYSKNAESKVSIGDAFAVKRAGAIFRVCK